MSRTHTSDGRRLSSMTHAKRAHQCSLCPRTVFGNGGVVAHGRGHVRRGEAVELVKHHGSGVSPSRVFLAPEDPNVQQMLARGFTKVTD